MKTNSLKKTVLLLCVAWLEAGSVQASSPGSVVAWGTIVQGYDYGQTDVPAAAQSGVTAIAANNLQTVALRSDGSVVGWGDNRYGQTNVAVDPQANLARYLAGEIPLRLQSTSNFVQWATLPLVPELGVNGAFFTLPLPTNRASFLRAVVALP